MKNKEILDNYSKYLKVNGRDENTIINHLSRIKQFLKKVEINQIDNKTVQEYFLELQNRLKPSSINEHILTLQVFLRFIKKKIELPDRQKTDKKIVECITPEYFKNELIPMADCLFYTTLDKVKAVLYFLFYTGIRLGELIYLERKDIDLEERIAKIYGEKTKTERKVKFDEETKIIIESYFMSEPEERNAFNIGYSGVKHIFVKLDKNLDKRIYPHLFRYSCAVMLGNRGMSERKIQLQMGHTDIHTTMRYLQYSEQDYLDDYDKAMKRKDKK